MGIRFAIYFMVKLDEEEFIRHFGAPHSHEILSECLTAYYFLEIIANFVIIYVHLKNIKEDWGDIKRSRSERKLL